MRHERNIKHIKNNDNSSNICYNIRIISKLYFNICFIKMQIELENLHNYTNENLTQSKLAKCLHMKNGAKIIKITNTNKINYKIMIKILEFISKNDKETRHVIVSTNFEEYKVEVFKDAQLKELRITPSITIATVLYQGELSRSLENKMQIIIL